MAAILFTMKKLITRSTKLRLLCSLSKNFPVFLQQMDPFQQQLYQMIWAFRSNLEINVFYLS